MAFRTHKECEQYFKDNAKYAYVYIIDNGERVNIIYAINSKPIHVLLGKVSYIALSKIDELIKDINGE